MKNKSLFLFLIVAILLTRCASANTIPDFKIIPTDCKLKPTETLAFSVQGEQAPGKSLQFQWSASDGSIIGLKDGVTAEYTAPMSQGETTITLSVSDGKSHREFRITCQIGDPTPPTMIPTPTQETEVTETNTPLPTTTGETRNIIISEVMINVCGGEDYKRYNQYIELYNNGKTPVDVGNLWIYAPNHEYRGQKIVAWDTRNPNMPFQEGLIFDSTVIPPGGVAVILPPQYTHAPHSYAIPYQFPENTVILTVEKGIRLGDQFYAMRATQDSPDVVILYEGGETAMSGQPISTYGSPRIWSKYLKDVYDNGEDAIPFPSPECYSTERINPNLPDTMSNWHLIYNGSPGEYVP